MWAVSKAGDGSRVRQDTVPTHGYGNWLLPGSSRKGAPNRPVATLKLWTGHSPVASQMVPQTSQNRRALAPSVARALWMPQIA